MNDQHDLELLIKAMTPIIVIETHEEVRVVNMFRELGLRLNRSVSKWSVTGGLERLGSGFQAQKFNTTPADVLGHLRSLEQGGIFLMLDFHPYLEEPIHTRLIREIAQNYRKVPKLMVFISAKLEVPKELAQKAARFELALPDKARILDIIKAVAVQWTQDNPGRKVAADRKAVEQLASNLLGLTVTEAERLSRKAIYDDGAITTSDIPVVMQAKYDLLSQGGVFSFELETAAFGDVGGLVNLKKWLHLRRAVFHGEGAEFGLDMPKGVMLLGVQGCGKSLAAKAVAGVWGAPLLRLDFGALYNKYMGETERNLRQALKTAEVMAPCVLWIDEIEKGLSSGDGDDGVSRRVLGTLLTWMSEKTKPVFIVATANDVTALPPELLRKGRFDELFFVDLPKPTARREIFAIQLQRRKLTPADFDLNNLARATEGFSGSEIEQAVVSSLYSALAQRKALNSTHLLDEIRGTRPLSVLMAEKVQQLRQWASQRTVPAD